MNRRNFVRGHAVVLAGLARPTVWRPFWANRPVQRAAVAPASLPDPVSITLRDPRVAQLALNVIDAARSAGAQYADVHLTNTRECRASSSTQTPEAPVQTVGLGLSVRALVNGYWGWAATPALTTDEGVRVAQLATTLARTGAAHGRPRTVDLGTIPVVTGDWATPMKIDPFDVDVLQLHHWFVGLAAHVGDLARARHATKSAAWNPEGALDLGVGGAKFDVRYTRQERLFASTEGSLVTQTITTLEPSFLLGRVEPHRLNFPVQAGWEWIADAPILSIFEEELDRMEAMPVLPLKPFDVGRYDVVLPASLMSEVVGGTFGDATQLDRALGYEANAGGTSYLGPDPLAHLGTRVAAPSITVTAEREMPLGLATVKWDDEGVVPEAFPLVRDGVLVNYQTTREQAAWLAPWYQKQGQPMRSYGCAAAPNALAVTMQHAPNLILHPGLKAETLETLIQGMEHGLLIESWNHVQMDWQCLDAYCLGIIAVEIKHGKRVAQLDGSPALTFRADQFWKDIQAMGGAGSAEINRGGSRKGDPAQWTPNSISVVPARIKQLALINPFRKAS